MKTSVTDNPDYIEFCKQCSQSDEMMSTFKRNPIYNYVLEHVHPIQGKQYLQIVRSYYPSFIPVIERIKENDKIGNPITIESEFGTFGTTTLRYFKIACEMAHCFPYMKNYNILEIGGGYGGQALISSLVSEFKSWTIIDLLGVIELQKKYLSYFNLQNVKSISCFEKLNEKFDMVVSNYAFSECVAEVQEEYMRLYMRNHEKIYMIWNHNDCSLSRDVVMKRLGMAILPEVPKTGKYNCLFLRGQKNNPAYRFEK